MYIKMAKHLTYDVATVVSDEGFAMDVDELCYRGLAELRVCAQTTQRNILCPLVLH